MTHPLLEAFTTRLASGLKRRSVTTPSQWSETYRVMAGSYPGPWSFSHYPWLKEMMDSKAQKNVGQKGAQLGYTELCLNLVFYKIDVEGKDCLYVLPAKTPDATDFSSSRFDAALELSPHLRNLFSDVKNVGHKRAGAANLYVRGSNSKGGLRSIPVGFIILDEVAVMHQGNIPLAEERSSGQLDKQMWMISTPTLENENINKQYNLSTKEHFFFKCPHCSKMTELLFPDCLVVTAEEPTDPKVKESYLKCKECDVRLEHGPRGDAKAEWLSNNEWVPEYSDRDVRGFHVNQLYSPTIEPYEIAQKFLKSKTDPAEEQEFYNSKLGITHAVEGAQVNDDEIATAIKNHRNTDKPPVGALLTMGVDVGGWCHYEIDSWTFPKDFSIQHLELARCKVIQLGKVRHFSDLDDLMRKFYINFCVIDANPEKRSALSFANRFHGLVRMCYYSRGISGKTINLGKDTDEPAVHVDRTSWLDLSLGRFHNSTIILPTDTTLEYKEHIKAPVRVYGKDKDGNPVGEYQSGTKPDHHAHSRNYAEIALPLAMSRGNSHDIGKVF